ncbi:zinc finger MYM-type protein 1-like [Olea europaea var. sylvestris]|uniref:zinc finger MYM-type protein 1-like n=1 Tax=Olea europaea var. sylvestris TaxID=158386 RepID=UPI000C1D0E66|nr:zinc finger MYM-type protein 1-like [Olea europaea var. sylvestris]
MLNEDEVEIQHAHVNEVDDKDEELFKTPINVTKVGELSNGGFNDWHNLYRSIKSHEGNEEHLRYMTSWIKLENREHWRHVLTRIIAIVKRLAKNILSFRGDDERLHVENNGLFLQIVEMVSEFDPVMQEHLRRAKAREIQHTYIGKKIQNELIQLLANEVRSSIVKKVKHAKYFAVILDCTPNASHEEQMSLIVRFIDDSANLPTVEEHWLKFLKVDDTTGLGHVTELQKALIKIDLDMDDIRGQRYDNESNMSGKHKGCILLRSDTTHLHIFSSSTKRWKIFKDNVQGLTVKPLSQTRWESHVESVKPIMKQTAQIRDALLDLVESNENPKVKNEAESLTTHELQNFEFLLSMIIWYRLLHAVNIVSKFLQTKSMDIDHAIDLLQGLVSFLE